MKTAEIVSMRLDIQHVDLFSNNSKCVASGFFVWKYIYQY